ncbi:MAG: response regulator [Myxococcales bacterium]|nr:response regulator [Myxococcales bacterium]
MPESTFAELTKGFEHIIEDPPDRVSWEQLCDVYDRFEKLFPPSELEKIGEKIVDTLPIGKTFRLTAKMVTNPIFLYTKVNQYCFKSIFSHIDHEHSVQPNRRIIIGLKIPEPYREHIVFFRFSIGVLRSLPRLLSLPDAVVISHITNREGVFEIIPPRSEALTARLSRRIKYALRSSEALDELNRQQNLLNAQHLRLQTAYDDIHKALETKQRFLAVINHELRTPLNGIIGSAEALKNDQNRENFDQHHENLHRSVHALTNLVESILHFIQDSSQLSLYPTQLSLRTLLETSAKEARERARHKGLRFTLDMDDALPRFIKIDGKRLSQALYQILDNAVKFTSKGKIVLRARLGQQKKQELVLQIQDSGIGIPESEQRKIFDLFVQLSNGPTRKYQGAGIGLAVAKHIIELLGGSIQLESHTQQGSLFSISVPFELCINSDSLQISQKIQALVVDDNTINRMVLSRILQKNNCMVDEAENGEIAVEKILSNTYSIVFMDIEMPIMNGIDAAKLVRDAGKSLPIIATTAYVTEDHHRECMHVGMNAFIPKPISHDIISHHLHQFINEM